ncbi:MAG: HAD family hydrolase [Vampirovibrio sp.]|nr:HAD family hydrolase [Vampirovibrio sp.]
MQNMMQTVFLDRDGTLNEEAGYIREVDSLALIPGSALAVKRFQEAGFLTVLTTNQTGPARGYYDEDHVLALNQRVQDLLQAEAGVKLHAVYYCPHLATGSVQPYAIACHCRKPETGMIQQAQQQFPNIDLSRSYVIGDKATDVDFGHNAGCRSVLLKTGYGQRVLDGEYQTLANPPDIVADDLSDAANQILAMTVSSH